MIDIYRRTSKKTSTFAVSKTPNLHMYCRPLFWGYFRFLPTVRGNAHFPHPVLNAYLLKGQEQPRMQSRNIAKTPRGGGVLSFLPWNNAPLTVRRWHILPARQNANYRLWNSKKKCSKAIQLPKQKKNLSMHIFKAKHIFLVTASQLAAWPQVESRYANHTPSCHTFERNQPTPGHWQTCVQIKNVKRSLHPQKRTEDVLVSQAGQKCRPCHSAT